MTSLIRIPFADSGDKAVVPENDAGGGVNMTQGYGQAYSLDPATDPSAKRIERDLMNGLFYMITKAIQELQINGIAPYISSADNGGSAFAYGLGAVVLYNGVAYQSLKSSNIDLPTVATSWAQVMNKETTTGRLLNVQTFTASGTYTPTPGTKRVRVKIWGGGGGGENAPVTAGASGGCAGGYSEGLFDIDSNKTISVTIGSGGSKVEAGTTASGGKGGGSSFGTLISATGGSGGGTPPAGGTGSGGNIINITGGVSQGGLYYGQDKFIGGAGGSAFSSTGGNGHFGSAGDTGGFPGSGGAGGNGNNASGSGAGGFAYIEEFS